MLSQKYRAWDGNSMRQVRMRYVAAEADAQGRELVAPADSTMQSTGKRDRSGNEIYEDDIVTFKTVLGVHLYGVVKYDPDRAAFTLYTGNELEVVGNVHMNPDLLEYCI